jgi:hypothetical protein
MHSSFAFEDTGVMELCELPQFPRSSQAKTANVVVNAALGDCFDFARRHAVDRARADLGHRVSQHRNTDAEQA